MGGLVRADKILVQKARIGLQHRLERVGWHGGPRRGDLEHPERGRRIGVFSRLADGGRESPQRFGHPLDGPIDGSAFVQVDPRDPQMGRVRESAGGRLAALEGARQLDIVTVQHVITISYYPVSFK